MRPPDGLLAALAANAATFAAPQGPAFDADREWSRCLEAGITVLTPAMEGYPALLSAAPSPPSVLYLRGELCGSPGLAVVGSRRPTPYGRRVARRLGRELADSGVVTVSGLARGIDAEAHQGAIDAGGATWAVLGSGLERVYPSENRSLADAIVERGGAVLSEAPLDAPPTAANFPRRNRVVSGLSWGTVVVEGNLKSGALITARCALDQGREVFAVPGPVDSPMSEGPHELLEKGAWLYRGMADILDILPPLRFSRMDVIRKPGDRERDAAHGPEETEILKSLGSDSLSMDELLRQTGLDIGRLSRVLMEMETKELLRAYPGQRYARR